MSVNQTQDIIFDLGGVLIDWNPRYLYRKLFQGDEAAMERFLSDICTPEWNARQDAGRPFSEGIAELIRRHPSRAELISVYDSRWDEMIGGAIEGSVDVLSELREAGYSIHALSNWSSEKFASMHDKFPFIGWFKTLVISGEVGVAKPDPAIFHYLLEQIDRSAQECLFIDDVLLNIETADKLGFQTIHFRSPVQVRSDLSQRGILPAP